MLKQVWRTLLRWNPLDLRHPLRRRAKYSQHLRLPRPSLLLMLVGSSRSYLKVVRAGPLTPLPESSPNQACFLGWRLPRVPRRSSRSRRHPLLRTKSPERPRLSLLPGIPSLLLLHLRLLLASRHLLPHLLLRLRLRLWMILILWTICCSKKF